MQDMNKIIERLKNIKWGEPVPELLYYGAVYCTLECEKRGVDCEELKSVLSGINVLDIEEQTIDIEKRTEDIGVRPYIIKSWWKYVVVGLVGLYVTLFSEYMGVGMIVVILLAMIVCMSWLAYNMLYVCIPILRIFDLPASKLVKDCVDFYSHVTVTERNTGYLKEMKKDERKAESACRLLKELGVCGDGIKKYELLAKAEMLYKE